LSSTDGVTAKPSHGMKGVYQHLRREAPAPLSFRVRLPLFQPRRIGQDGDTYRAVYTFRFAGVIYVLHAFQKKSKKGIETPKREIEVIKARLKVAEAHYRENYGKGRNK
jgi:hypothetical protein